MQHRPVGVGVGERRVLSAAEVGGVQAAGEKRQFVMVWERSGGRPGMLRSRSAGLWSSLGTDARRASEYGWRMWANSSAVSASSATLPAYMTTTRSVRPAMTPMSWVISITAMFNLAA